MMSMSSPDVIVVGGGTAGSVVAARLSEDPNRRVLLLEAGPTTLPTPGELLDARLVPGARAASSWHFPGSISAGREWTHVRGRVLGGSSTTNGGYFIPPGREDVAEWTALAGEGWSWEAIRGVERAIERDLDMPTAPEHGHGGPLPVTRADPAHPAIAAFRSAASAAGLAVDLDKGADWSDGFGVTPANREGPVRVNTAMAYLHPALSRPNLTVLGEATVIRIVLSHGRATGVEVVLGSEQRVIPTAEVVVAAGALRTPDLLSLSGIRLPGLGEGLHDDPQLLLDVSGWPGGDVEDDTWLGGVVHTTMSDGASVEVLQSLHPLARIAGGEVAPGAPGPLFVSTSGGQTGRLVRTSGDPQRLPRVEFDHLATAAARERLRGAVRFAADIVRAGRGTLTNLERGSLLADRPLDAWIRAHLGTAFHTTGGAALGAVVDPAGRVHDTDGLRVADLSLLPAGLRRGPAAAAVLVGELLSRT